MTADNFADRLKLFLNFKGINSSSFADMCGIPRPSLSQILNGRNKKINDNVVRQIHERFPEVSVMWLLFGEGEMINTPAGVCEAVDESSAFPVDPSGAMFADSFPAGEVHDTEGPAPYGNNHYATDWHNEIGNSGSNPSEISGFPSTRADGAKYGRENGVKVAENRIKELERQIVEWENKCALLEGEIEKIRQNPRKVSHITVFYDDSTFETFSPER